MASDIVMDATEKMAQVKDAAGRGRYELFEVLSLIHAAFDLAEGGGNLCDVDEKMTSADSRLQSLLIMARDKTASAINHLDFV